MKLINVFVATLLLVLLSSCGIKQASIKAYDGPDRALSDLALVKPVTGIIIDSIDGNSDLSLVVWGNSGTTDAEISLIPGEHVFRLRYQSIDLVSAAIDLDVSVVAGRKYILNAKISGGIGDLVWEPRVIDVTDEPEKWCVTGYGNCNSEGRPKLF